jgi:hypothetical protein
VKLSLFNKILIAGVVPVIVAAPIFAQVRTVTDIQIIETETELEVVLDTLSDEPLEAFLTREGDSVIVNIPNAQLSGSEFRQLNPFAGVTEVTAVNIGNDIQVRITGETRTLQAEVIQSTQGLVLNVTPVAEMAEDDEIEVNVQLRYIDPSSIERIEIVRGPSAIYGAEATGGVINIITRRPEEDRLTSITEVGVTAALGELEEDSFGTELRRLYRSRKS